MVHMDEVSEDSAGSSKVRSNRIPLNDALVRRFRTLYANLQQGTRDLEALAYHVRVQYLQADGQRYDPAFEKWWRTYEMAKIFGSRANFTKYANAGEAMEKANVHQYADRMPVSLAARYEVSQLEPDEIALCVENRYSRSTVGAEPTTPRRPTPVIHPNATAKEIRNWKKRWRHPTGDGTSSSELTIETVADIERAVLSVLEPFSSTSLSTEIRELLRRTRRRLERAAEKATKKKIKSGSGSTA
jgi:hypothetical protein